jgi:hypothetical protein
MCKSNLDISSFNVTRLIDSVLLENARQRLDELLVTDITRSSDIARSKRGKRCKIRYYGLRFRSSKERIVTLFFEGVDPLGSGRVHQIQVQIPSYKEISNDKNTNYVEKLKLALNAGDVKIHCSCEDFLYQGFTYISWNLDYGLVPELRAPKIRNPKLKGTACKHALSVLQKINLFGITIAKDLASGKETNYRKVTR